MIDTLKTKSNPRKVGAVFMALQYGKFVQYSGKGLMKLYLDAQHTQPLKEWLQVWHCQGWLPHVDKYPYKTMTLKWENIENLVNTGTIIHTLAIRLDCKMAMFVNGYHILNFVKDQTPEEIQVKNSTDKLRQIQMPVVPFTHKIFDLRKNGIENQYTDEVSYFHPVIYK